MHSLPKPPPIIPYTKKTYCSCLIWLTEWIINQPIFGSLPYIHAYKSKKICQFLHSKLGADLYAVCKSANSFCRHSPCQLLKKNQRSTEASFWTVTYGITIAVQSRFSQLSELYSRQPLTVVTDLQNLMHPGRETLTVGEWGVKGTRTVQYFNC